MLRKSRINDAMRRREQRFFWGALQLLRRYWDAKIIFQFVNYELAHKICFFSLLWGCYKETR